MDRKIYNESLSKLNNVFLPTDKTNYAKNIYWVYGIVFKKHSKLKAREVIKKMSKLELVVDLFCPMHKCQYLKKWVCSKMKNIQ